MSAAIELRKPARAGLRRLAVGLAAVLWAALAATAAGAAVPTPEQDPFYAYAGQHSAGEHRPGHRAEDPDAHLPRRRPAAAGQGRAAALPLDRRDRRADRERHLGAQPPLALGSPKVVAYQSFYDSLNPDDEPSYSISGGLTLGGAIPDVESLAVRARAARRQRGRRRRHRGRDGRLRRRARVRDQHARLAARGAEPRRRPASRRPRRSA